VGVVTHHCFVSPLFTPTVAGVRPINLRLLQILTDPFVKRVDPTTWREHPLSRYVATHAIQRIVSFELGNWSLVTLLSNRTGVEIFICY
jgi:hypothetical protein